MIVRRAGAAFLVLTFLAAAVAASSPAADDEDQTGGTSLLWSTLPSAPAMKPHLMALARASTGTPGVWGPLEDVEVTVTNQDQKIFRSASLTAPSGLVPFVFQPAGDGDLVFHAAAKGESSARTTLQVAGGHGHHGHGGASDDGRNRADWAYDQQTGTLELRKRTGGTRALVDLLDASENLLLSVWARALAPTTDTDFYDITVDPSIGNLKARAYVMSMQGMSVAETSLPGPQIGTPALPSLSDLDPPNVGVCDNVLRVNPPSSEGEWSRGTLLHVSFVDAAEVEPSNPLQWERDVTYSLERVFPQGPRVALAWTTHDAWGTAMLRPPQPGDYKLIATDGPARRCQVPLRITDTPTTDEAIQVDVSVTNETRPWPSTRWAHATVNLSAPGLTDPRSYALRVVRVGADTHSSRLVWTGLVHGSAGAATFELGGLEEGKYQLYVHPSLERGAGVRNGAVHTLDVGDPPPRQRPVEEPSKDTSGFLLLAALASAILVAGRRRLRGR